MRHIRLGGLVPQQMNERAEEYVVTGEVKDKNYRRVAVTKPQTKQKAQMAADDLEHAMRIAVPEYQWIRKIKVEPAT